MDKDVSVLLGIGVLVGFEAVVGVFVLVGGRDVGVAESVGDGIIEGS